MNVANLRQHLADLGNLLEASGAKAVSKDLAALAEALKPFQERTLQDFARFLGKAREQEAGGGRAPEKTKEGKPGRTSPAKPKPDPEEVARRVRQVYDRAGDLSMKPEEID